MVPKQLLRLAPFVRGFEILHINFTSTFLQIEEASAEEEELLGKNNDLEEGEEGEDGNTIVRDEELIKVLVSFYFIFHNFF